MQAGVVDNVVEDAGDDYSVGEDPANLTFHKAHITSTAARAPGLLPGARDSPTNAQPEQVMHRRTKGQLVRKTWDRIDDHRAYFFSLAGAAVNRDAMELRQAIQERVAWPRFGGRDRKARSEASNALGQGEASTAVC